MEFLKWLFGKGSPRQPEPASNPSPIPRHSETRLEKCLTALGLLVDNLTLDELKALERAVRDLTNCSIGKNVFGGLFWLSQEYPWMTPEILRCLALQYDVDLTLEQSRLLTDFNTVLYYTFMGQKIDGISSVEEAYARLSATVGEGHPDKVLSAWQRKIESQLPIGALDEHADQLLTRIEDSLERQEQRQVKRKT